VNTPRGRHWGTHGRHSTDTNVRDTGCEYVSFTNWLGMGSKSESGEHGGDTLNFITKGTSRPCSTVDTPEHPGFISRLVVPPGKCWGNTDHNCFPHSCHTTRRYNVFSWSSVSSLHSTALLRSQPTCDVWRGLSAVCDWQAAPSSRQFCTRRQYKGSLPCNLTESLSCADSPSRLARPAVLEGVGISWTAFHVTIISLVA
jgi:hypothetical protein